MDNCIESLSEAQLQQVHGLMQREWWCAERSLDEARAVVLGSDLIIAHLNSEGVVIAFLRVLTDGAAKAIIFDVIVSDHYRSTGLGKKLVEHALAHPLLKPVNSIELYCPDQISGFYQKMGFTVSESKLHVLRPKNLRSSNVKNKGN